MSDRTMRWRIHVDARDDGAATTVATRVGALVEQRLNVEQIEPYWKIPEQRIVSADLKLRADGFSEAVVEALKLASAVAGGWHVTCPEETSDGEWHFDGWASGNFRVAGVEFASWTLAAHVDGSSDSPDDA